MQSNQNRHPKNATEKKSIIENKFYLHRDGKPATLVLKRALARTSTRPLARFEDFEAVEQQRAKWFAERDAGHIEHRAPV